MSQLLALFVVVNKPFHNQFNIQCVITLWVITHEDEKKSSNVIRVGLIVGDKNFKCQHHPQIQNNSYLKQLNQVKVICSGKLLNHLRVIWKY